ncbi:lysine-2,3-aminomutase-like protein [Magnetospirillum moscoviense]|uniref:Lysine 2,3-aminomutase n=1 Tax=Magnetospirillum moscoviense TaxID=1437059 RepID=A0A178MMQ3_9PROT|nr:lysine-2,3-aminomutase-like protein [Magnetospirillum moscoviense]OAN49823.1 lysine 2,3-aminomutase [Magnetospirillum moscoviense]
MLQAKPPVCHRRTLRTAAELVEAGLARPSAALDLLAETTAIAVPPALAELMVAGQENDPIARQFVPSPDELVTSAEERADPIGDEAYSPVKGLVHRYPDRVLIKPILVCPVYCRFCFRKDRVGDADATLSASELDAAFAYVAARPDLREIIFTGGDPLMLNAARLADLAARAASIGHVELTRFHTRVPIATPERVTAELVAALRSGPPAWVSVHVNHPRELSGGAGAALARLADAGIPLIAQTVLLKGVNDDAGVLEALFRALIRARVRPYYLHHPDLVPGTSHLRPTIQEGQALMRALRGRLSGIAQPTYVLDIPGGAGKVPIGPDWLVEDGVQDADGVVHAYPVAKGGPTC